MATSTPGDPLKIGLDVPPLPEARAAFLAHQAKRPQRPPTGSPTSDVIAYDQALGAWLTTKDKLSLRLELAQAQERTGWKPCALPDHPCPQPADPLAPAPIKVKPLRFTRKPQPEEAPMTKGIYARKQITPKERLARLLDIFREARTPSSQRNARQKMRDLCRKHGLPLPDEVNVIVSNKPIAFQKTTEDQKAARVKGRLERLNRHSEAQSTPKAQPEPTGAIAALQSPAQAAKGVAAPESAATRGSIKVPEDLIPPSVAAASAVPAKAALLRMRKDGWLLLAITEGLSKAERATLRETIEMVHGQLDMALTLVGGAA